MRLQISLPTDTWERVKECAQVDRRSPKQQIEFFVIQAVREQGAPASKEVAHAG